LIHLDTHVVVWLYAGDVTGLLAPVVSVLEREDLAVSPMVELELEYLHEIGRLVPTGRAVLDDLAARVGLQRRDVGFAAAVGAASGLRWTRDPFDRLIVASAIVEGVTLLTRDETILEKFDGAVWDGRPRRRKRR